MSNKIKWGTIGAIVTLILTVGALLSAWNSARTAKKALEVQMQQLQLDKEAAERERNKAKDETDIYRKQLQDAPTIITKRIGTLIRGASYEINMTERQPQLIPAAKALVSARNSFRSVLESIGDRLDSDIDQLEIELSKDPPDLAKISELIEVLNRKWPAKKDEVEIAVRKLLAELGLVRRA
jgi:hypothetical protein